MQTIWNSISYFNRFAQCSHVSATQINSVFFPVQFECAYINAIDPFHIECRISEMKELLPNTAFAHFWFVFASIRFRFHKMLFPAFLCLMHEIFRAWMCVRMCNICIKLHMHIQVSANFNSVQSVSMYNKF